MQLILISIVVHVPLTLSSHGYLLEISVEVIIGVDVDIIRRLQVCFLY